MEKKIEAHFNHQVKIQQHLAKIRKHLNNMSHRYEVVTKEIKPS